MYLELLISGSFKILFCVLIYMFLSAQVVLLLSCMYLCVCHWFSSYTWQSLVADVDSLYVGLSSWWGSSFVRMAGFEEDFIWSASIHNSSPGFPPSIYSDPLEKHSKAFFSPSLLFWIIVCIFCVLDICGNLIYQSLLPLNPLCL